ncbi:MAG: hypothetical protein ACOX5J_10715 [Candidatus Hydrogenedentales bacterium]|jgi:hypothetical protein
MNLHVKAITKPCPADVRDTQNALTLIQLYTSILTQLNSFVASIKSRSSS